MSLSRAELEGMDRDELVDAVATLSQTVEDLQARVSEDFDSAARERATIQARLTTVEDENERLRDANQDLRDRLDDVEATAQAALQATTGDADERSQTEIAAALTRNWLVVKAATDCPPQDRPVTIGEVRERAKPEHALDWQTVRNGWDNVLLQEWPQFHETTKRGEQALSLRPGKVTPALAKVAQADLGRDDLTKRFVGENGGGRP